MIQLVATSASNDATNKHAAAQSQVAKTIQDLVPNRFIGETQLVVDDRPVGIKHNQIASRQMLSEAHGLECGYFF
jgi:hypothetical protein